MFHHAYTSLPAWTDSLLDLCAYPLEHTYHSILGISFVFFGCGSGAQVIYESCFFVHAASSS